MHFERDLPEVGETLLVVREDQGATACASPEESNETRRFLFLHTMLSTT
ncbi:hypothetical protein EXIGUO9Y_230039 [Exiguobacterium oxidotolerans]|uniref:Uncharacterized protein n=1 Tax=Exiguobacterium oxidotolerans TaxID=223958 RepID=A0A653I825_9BACL|nr:hypothetical protein EXIGUO9Y_230039 [Exiguobacterium oxidotolerans]